MESNKITVNTTACATCPYAKSTPPGVWHRDEYEKLRRYDHDTAYQPPCVFMCHQRDGSACAGWVAVHGENLLGLRLAMALGTVDFPLPEIDGDFYASGNAAADAGIAGIEQPGVPAIKAIDKIKARRVVGLELCSPKRYMTKTAINEFNRSAAFVGAFVVMHGVTFAQTQPGHHNYHRSSWPESQNRLRQVLPMDCDTTELLADSELMASFKQGVEDIEAGKGVAWNDLKQQLGL